jgi:dTDP-glucose 4,6-dehydratase
LKSFPPLPKEDLQHILNQTASLWEEARGKSFFITGGTGFFGIWLLESFCYINDLLSLHAKATVLTRNPAAFATKAPHLFKHSHLNFQEGDIRNFSYPTEKYDYLIHAATEASATLNNDSPHEMLDAIVSGMRNILQFAAHAKISKMLFTSSGAVYGPQPSEITHISEDYNGAPNCLDPRSAYGEGKRIAELMAAIHAKHHPCEIKIARCFAFIGPHLPLDSHFAIGNFIRDAMAGNPIQIQGDGTPFRSYLYAADLAIWLWTILFKGQSLRAYNVGSSDHICIRDLASLVENNLHTNTSIEASKDITNSKNSSRYVPSTVRAQTELGLTSHIELAHAIRRTAEWLKSV